MGSNENSVKTVARIGSDTIRAHPERPQLFCEGFPKLGDERLGSGWVLLQSARISISSDFFELSTPLSMALRGMRWQLYLSRIPINAVGVAHGISPPHPCSFNRERAPIPVCSGGERARLIPRSWQPHLGGRAMRDRSSVGHSRSASAFFGGFRF